MATDDVTVDRTYIEPALRDLSARGAHGEKDALELTAIIDDLEDGGFLAVFHEIADRAEADESGRIIYMRELLFEAAHTPGVKGYSLYFLQEQAPAMDGQKVVLIQLSLLGRDRKKAFAACIAHLKRNPKN